VGGINAWLYYLSEKHKKKIDLSEIRPLVYPLFSKKPLQRYFYKLVNLAKIYYKKTLIINESRTDFEVIEHFVNQKNTLLITDQNDAYEVFSKRMKTILNFTESSLKFNRNGSSQEKVKEIIIFSTIPMLEECLIHRRKIANYYDNEVKIVVILRHPTGQIKKQLENSKKVEYLQFNNVFYYTKVGLPEIRKIQTFINSKLTNFKISRVLIYCLMFPIAATAYVISNILQSRPIHIIEGLEIKCLGIILR
jgi:hypothetical protein